jgi:hypothetical protein
MLFRWACLPSDNSSQVPDACRRPCGLGANTSTTGASLEVPRGALAAACAYVIELTVSKPGSGRYNTARIDVSVIEGSVPVVTVELAAAAAGAGGVGGGGGSAATGLVGLGPKRVNQDAKVVLIGRVDHSRTTQPQWQLIQGSLDFEGDGSPSTPSSSSSSSHRPPVLAMTGTPQQQLRALMLVLSPNSLVPGVQYTFRLSVENDLNVTGYADIQIEVNQLPRSGYLLAAPDAGRALTTPFTLRGLGWVDEDLPLVYRFGFMVGDHETTALSPSPSAPSSASSPSPSAAEAGTGTATAAAEPPLEFPLCSDQPQNSVKDVLLPPGR